MLRTIIGSSWQLHYCHRSFEREETVVSFWSSIFVVELMVLADTLRIKQRDTLVYLLHTISNEIYSAPYGLNPGHTGTPLRSDHCAIAQLSMDCEECGNSRGILIEPKWDKHSTRFHPRTGEPGPKIRQIRSQLTIYFSHSYKVTASTEGGKPSSHIFGDIFVM